LKILFQRGELLPVAFRGEPCTLIFQSPPSKVLNPSFLNISLFVICILWMKYGHLIYACVYLVLEGLNSVTYNLVFNNVPLWGICFSR